MELACAWGWWYRIPRATTPQQCQYFFVFSLEPQFSLFYLAVLMAVIINCLAAPSSLLPHSMVIKESIILFIHKRDLSFGKCIYSRILSFILLVP